MSGPLVEMNLEMLVFVEGGKLENLQLSKNLEARREPIANSTHIIHGNGLESNLGGISGRGPP